LRWRAKPERLDVELALAGARAASDAAASSELPLPVAEARRRDLIRRCGSVAPFLRPRTTRPSAACSHAGRTTPSA
jgi:hypothetical protein